MIYKIKKRLLFISLLLISPILGCSNNSEVQYTFTKIAAKEPTCLDEGNDEYYICEENGKYYSDPEGKNELPSIPIIPAKGHSETDSYLFDETNHWKERYCEHKDLVYEPHSFDDGVCSICGYSTIKPNIVTMEYVEYQARSAVIGEYSEPGDSIIISDRNIVIEKPGDYLLSDIEIDTITISSNQVTLLFDNITIFNPIEARDVESICVLVKNDSKNYVKSNLINFEGQLLVYGQGTIIIDNQTDYPAICVNRLSISESTIVITGNQSGINAIGEKSVVRFSKCNLNIDVKGDGIYSEGFVYIDSSFIDITTTGLFVEKSTANKEKYHLTGKDFIFKKAGSNYGKRPDLYNDYAIINNARGLCVSGDKNIYLNTPFQYVAFGILIDNSTLNIDSSDDAIFSEYGFVSIKKSIAYVSSKVNAIRANSIANIENSKVITSFCYEGIEGAQVQLFSSTITVESEDDCIESSNLYGLTKNIIVDGGIINVCSHGDDGFDAENYSYIKSGNVTLDGTSVGEGFDCDKGVYIDGGSVIAMSNHTYTPFIDKSKQPIIYLNSGSSKFGGNNDCKVYDSDGKLVISGTPTNSFGNVLLSHYNFAIGEQYTIIVGNEFSKTISLDKIVTTINVD